MLRGKTNREDILMGRVHGKLGIVEPWRKSCRMESLEQIGSCSILRKEEMRVCRVVGGARG